MKSLQPSLWTGYYPFLSPEETVLAFQRGGFSCAELCLEDGNALLSRGKNEEAIGLAFRSFLEENDFSVPQGHLDFSREITCPEFRDHLKRTIVLYRAIGIRNGVIHLNGAKKEENESLRWEQNLAALAELQDFVRGTDFTLCLENLNSCHLVTDAERILRVLRALGGTNLGICLDTGHLNRSQYRGITTETQGEFIRKAGPFLKALHVNGNNGMSDQHLAPFAIRGSVNYKEVLRALGEIRYEGPFNLEIPGERSGIVPRSVLDLKLFYLKDLADLMLAPEFLLS